MFRVGSWLYNKAAPTNVSTQSLDALAESQELESALAAATLIMNDDVDGAEERLDKGDSSFHKLGKGIVTFVRATLGLEQEIMRQAAERLAEAETSAFHDQRKAHHNSNARNAYQSAIYAPGTEYILCQSMAQLMAALVGVLNESLTESIKAFYKLRKAYIALDGIMRMEEEYLQKHARGQNGLKTHPHETTHAQQTDTNPLAEPVDGQKIDGQPSSGASGEGQEQQPATPSGDRDQMLERRLSSLDSDPDIFSNPVDSFIHSGANLCFGLLLLLISMVPPAFSKLLYIVGFKGDRTRGLRLLWQASKFHSLTGAISALGLLAFYNGFVRCCDILPDSSCENEDGDVDGYPHQRLATLLSDMRNRFPLSQLWLLEQSRMEAANKRLDVALELLSTGAKSQLKQVEALHVFEKSMNAMYLHKYDLCAQSFIECVELNSWSRGLYYYIAGGCHLSLYRESVRTSPSTAKEHAAKATEYFRKVPTQAGKKKFMARQLPFDIFVTRKVSKWEARAKEWNIDFIDAIGINPVEEMIYFWNGHSRMTDDHLNESMKRLNWSKGDDNKTWHRETIDERAILAVLQASILRSLRRHDESKAVLRSEILCHDKAAFKGHLKDDWTCPSAHYEMAANLWMERRGYRPINADFSSSNAIDSADEANPPTENASQLSKTVSLGGSSKSSKRSVDSSDRERVRECKEWLEKVAKWEAFEMDARVGLKVATAEETLRLWEASNGKPTVSAS